MMRYFTLLMIFLLSSCQPALAAVPHDAKPYQRELTRNARTIFGLDAPVSLFAVQIHQESTWQLDAKSYVGAQGLVQFMPSTADWISAVYPDSLGDNQPYNPSWSMRVLVQYDFWLYQRVKNTATNCDRWAFVLSAYNGGLGWVNSDRNQAGFLFIGILGGLVMILNKWVKSAKLKQAIVISTVFGIVVFFIAYSISGSSIFGLIAAVLIVLLIGIGVYTGNVKPSGSGYAGSSGRRSSGGCGGRSGGGGASGRW